MPHAADPDRAERPRRHLAGNEQPPHGGPNLIPSEDGTAGVGGGMKHVIADGTAKLSDADRRAMARPLPDVAAPAPDAVGVGGGGMRTFVLMGLVACGAKVADPPAPGAPPPMVCGGIGGIRCPVGTACADDTRDDCDPKAGGADCSGLCTACDAIPGRRTMSADPEQCKAMKFACEDGEVAWFDGCGCGCAAP